jgi:hypothetical protein
MVFPHVPFPHMNPRAQECRACCGCGWTLRIPSAVHEKHEKVALATFRGPSGIESGPAYYMEDEPSKDA